MKKILIVFTLVASAIMILTVFSSAIAAAPWRMESNSNYAQPQSIVVSPPRTILSEIYFLESNEGTFVSQNNYTVASENGEISIVSKVGDGSVIIINTSARPSPYEFELVSELNDNVTDGFLYSTNGYLNSITNAQNLVTGIITNNTINMENGVPLLLKYPWFASAIIYWDSCVTPDSLPPPGGGGISVDNVQNHTWMQLPNSGGNDILQSWFNVSLVWDYSSTGTPQVINLWMNGTSEAAAVYVISSNGYCYTWSQTIFNMGPSPYTWWGWSTNYDGGGYYMEPVNNPAQWWVFATEITNESHQQPSPFGNNIIFNASVNYGDQPGPILQTDVWIAQQ